MSVSPQDINIVERMFKAMQTGLSAEHEMMALFSDNASFTEPFSGQTRTHQGKDAIRAIFIDMWNEPGPPIQLTTDRVDLDGDIVHVDWTCHSEAFETPMKGHDRFDIQDGLIQSLEVTVTEMPPMVRVY